MNVPGCSRFHKLCYQEPPPREYVVCMGGGVLNHQHIEQYHPPHKLLPKDLKTGLTKKGGYEGYN